MHHDADTVGERAVDVECEEFTDCPDRRGERNCFGGEKGSDGDTRDF